MCLWHISQIIVYILSHVVIACILNQSKGFWLSNDALNVAISMNLKLKDKMNHLPLLNVLINDIDDLV
jgi:hypothetical protein